MSATLGELVQRGLALEVSGAPETIVSGVRHDSREVEAGDLFVAIEGERTDGARFAADALARGAAALASQSRVPFEIPQLRVADARAALGALAAAVYGDPTRALRVVGLTGTNGKTTTCWLIEQALSVLGARPALLGTIESRGPGFREAVAHTTPEGDAIARFARRAVDAGATHLVMEVSSHALALRRADAVHFAVAGFTNLTQDHLDFHPSMEAYFEAKARLFEELAPERSVVLVDDAWGALLAARIGARAGAGLVRVSRRSEEAAEIRVSKWRMTREGIRAEVAIEDRSVSLESPLIGAHNLDNLLVALGALRALGYDATDAAGALAGARGAPGRLERVDGLPAVTVLVDYAHTPDALERALAALRPITGGRLIVVFGCGGDRDRKKRPLMGAASARGADLLMLTSDNPRTEDPHAILAAIEGGLGDLSRASGDAWAGASRAYEVIEDRRAAIRAAIFAARPGDTILIAGKGHEDYQIRGQNKFHFDDRLEARAQIAARVGGQG